MNIIPSFSQIFSSFLLFLVSTGYLCVCAKDPFKEIDENPLKAGGVYFAYPDPIFQESGHTNPPSGYKPIYISHIGRHGSRYLLKETDYTRPLITLTSARDAGQLSEKGIEILNTLSSIYQIVIDRAGDLTQKGEDQQKRIANRMFSHYPEVFDSSKIVIAHSTMVMRCAMSMSSFCERLNPY